MFFLSLFPFLRRKSVEKLNFTHLQRSLTVPHNTMQKRQIILLFRLYELPLKRTKPLVQLLPDYTKTFLLKKEKQSNIVGTREPPPTRPQDMGNECCTHNCKICFFWVWYGIFTSTPQILRILSTAQSLDLSNADLLVKQTVIPGGSIIFCLSYLCVDHNPTSPRWGVFHNLRGLTQTGQRRKLPEVLAIN